MISSDQRRDPHLLLPTAQQQELQDKRGKLRIYFGSSAGAGKTYAMVAAAQRLRSESYNVLVGVVETHGRAETAALLDGMEVLPLESLSYREKALPEFDLDGALARRPQLI